MANSLASRGFGLSRSLWVSIPCESEIWRDQLPCKSGIRLEPDLVCLSRANRGFGVADSLAGRGFNLSQILCRGGVPEKSLEVFVGIDFFFLCVCLGFCTNIFCNWCFNYDL